MPTARVHGRRKELFTTVVALLLVLNAYHLWLGKRDFSPIARASFYDRQTHFRDRFYLLLGEHAPQCEPLQLSESAGWPRYNANFATPRENHIDRADEMRQPLQTAHDGFVCAIRSPSLEVPFIAATAGIVSAAGGKYMPTFIVTLRLLRRTGCALPVELFVRDATEYEPRICEEVLPALNARCVVLSNMMGLQPEPNHHDDDDDAVQIGHYQLKSFAVLFATFETVVWLDADCIPVHDPTALLSTDPFLSTGLVAWPDYWASTISPLYFNVSRQVEFPTTDRATTEAGVFLVSKRSHPLTLLLAAYYNYYGPSHYYHLLAQGAPGEGDKDTFVQAAAAVDEPFYTVSEKVADLGRRRFDWSDQDIIHVAMMQADPRQDYALVVQQGKRRVEDPSVAAPPRAFFVHANMVKFNPGGDLLDASRKEEEGARRRLWTAPEESIQRLGYDVERAAWEEVREVSCALDGGFGAWEDVEGLCEGVRRHWAAVFEDASAHGLNFTLLSG